jgi:hypothetical protein
LCHDLIAQAQVYWATANDNGIVAVLNEIRESSLNIIRVPSFDDVQL